jgi:putative aldouronate transport system substrate-binding protein
VSKLKKVLTLLLACLLIIAAVAGCGGKSDKKDTADKKADSQESSVGDGESDNFNLTGLPIVKNKVTLKFAAPKSASLRRSFDELTFFKNMEEATNVKIEWNTPDSETEWAEKRNLMIASLDLPDAFYAGSGFTDIDLMNFGEQGLFIPLEDYIDKYGDHIKKLFIAQPEYKIASMTPDGHIYALPEFEEGTPLVGTAFFMNVTWLNKLNLSVPTTADEFYEVLKAFKNNDLNGNSKLDEIPLGFQALGGVRGIRGLYGAFGQMALSPATKINVKDGELYFSPIQPEFKEAIKYFSKLFAEGLIDIESIAQDTSVYMSKVRSEEQLYGSFLGWSKNYFFGSEDHPDYEPIQYLKAPDGKLYSGYSTAYFGRSGFIITNACKSPEIAYRWGDYQYDPIVGIQAAIGTLGEMMKQNDDGTLEYYPTPEGKTFDEWRGESCPAWSALGAIYDEIMRIKLAPSDDFVEKYKHDEFYKDAIKYDIFKPDMVFMTADESERLAILETDIKTYVDQMEAKWIQKGGIDEEWDGYVKKLGEMGLEEMMEIYSGIYKRLDN